MKIIGGRSTHNSIQLSTEDHTFKASFNSDSVKITKDSFIDPKIQRKLNKIPIVRNLAFLPLPFLILIFFADIFIHFSNAQVIPHKLLLPIDTIIILFAINGIIEVARARKNHAAEHMIANALTEVHSTEVHSTESLQNQSKFHPQCGTNLFVCVLLAFPICCISITLTVIVAVELFNVIPSNFILFKIAQKITTKQPDKRNLELAIKVAKTIQKYYAESCPLVG